MTAALSRSLQTKPISLKFYYQMSIPPVVNPDSFANMFNDGQTLFDYVFEIKQTSFSVFS